MARRLISLLVKMFTTAGRPFSPRHCKRPRARAGSTTKRLGVIDAWVRNRDAEPLRLQGCDDEKHTDGNGGVWAKVSQRLRMDSSGQRFGGDLGCWSAAVSPTRYARRNPDSLVLDYAQNGRRAAARAFTRLRLRAGESNSCITI